MAYTNCIGTLAKNIALECSTPLEGGYTGRAIAIPYSVAPSITKSAQDPRLVTSLSVGDDKHVIMIDNVYQAPFSGSTTTGNVDGGRTRYQKLVACMIPLRGSDTSKDLIEPLVNDPEGFLLILEKRDHRGNGSYEIVGLQAPAKVDPTTVTRDESANGGAIALTFTTTEDWFECTLFATDYASTRTLFEGLIAKAY